MSPLTTSARHLRRYCAQVVRPLPPAGKRQSAPKPLPGACGDPPASSPPPSGGTTRPRPHQRGRRGGPGAVPLRMTALPPSPALRGSPRAPPQPSLPAGNGTHAPPASPSWGPTSFRGAWRENATAPLSLRGGFCDIGLRERRRM